MNRLTAIGWFWLMLGLVFALLHRSDGAVWAMFVTGQAWLVGANVVGSRK